MSAHAIERAMERYGMRIDTSDIAAMQLLIASHDPRVICLGTRQNLSGAGKLTAIRFTKEGHAPRWLIGLVIEGRIITFFQRTDIAKEYDRRLGERLAKLKSMGLEPSKLNRKKTERSLCCRDKEAAWEAFERYQKAKGGKDAESA